MPNLPSIFDSSITSSNPFRAVAKMQRQMDRLFDRMLSADVNDMDLIPTEGFIFSPACDVNETETHYLMSFDVPGVKKEDIKIDLRGHTLTVSGEKKEEFEQKNGSVYKTERSSGSFLRSFELPEDIKAGQIEALYENGVLRVAIPKTEASKTEQIKIGEGKSGLWGKLLTHKKEETKTQH